MIEKVLARNASEGGDLYFNRGSSALKFLLECVASFLGRPPRVCLQSFNCRTVLDAALEAGALVTLSDIKLEDLSVPLSFLEECGPLDVVVMLHYQGRPNFEREGIAEHCRTRQILLVEDLAHCIDGWQLCGDFGIHSYAFDKPLTCLSGGKIVCNSENKELVRALYARYEALPLENPQTEVEDLRLLRYLYATSAPEAYRGTDGPLFLVRILQRLGVSDLRIHALAVGRVGRVAAKVASALARARALVSASELFPVARLGGRKRALLEMQREHLLGSRDHFVAIAQEVAKVISGPDSHASSELVDWNRLSVLRGDAGRQSDFSELGIEASNYNWPVPLHRIARGGLGPPSGFQNSELACREVLNVPVWTEAVAVLLRHRVKR